MKDPVNEFEYPQSWVDACTDPSDLDLVKKGLAVLTSSGRTLRRGFTTGTTAAAAAKAAVLSLRSSVGSVEMRLPCGLEVDVPVKGASGRGTCVKFSGDYPSDATASIMFVAQATPQGKGITITFGKGIGRLSRDMGRYKLGEAAVSPPAYHSILTVTEEALKVVGLDGVKVEIEAANGEAIAKRTLNSKVGVVGGISVLGTTGLVEPWDDHLEESNLERIERSDKVVLTTGRNGLKFSRLMFPDHEVVLVGSKLDKAVQAAQGQVILCGLPALILKFIDPDVLSGTDVATVEELIPSTRWNSAMQKAFARSKRERPKLRVVVLDRQGQVLGDSG